MTFKVEISKMTESHRVTWWVALTNTDVRPADANFMDSIGKMTPFYSTEKWQVEQEAQEWADFLGVKITGAYHDYQGPTYHNRTETFICARCGKTMTLPDCESSRGHLNMNDNTLCAPVDLS